MLTSDYLLKEACKYEANALKAFLSCIERFDNETKRDMYLKKLEEIDPEFQSIECHFTHLQNSVIKSAKYILLNDYDEYLGICLDTLPDSDKEIEEIGVREVINQLVQDSKDKLYG